MREIKPRSSLNAAVWIPGSKSITHRALIAAGLAKGESLLNEALSCEDTLCTISGLRELGITISTCGNKMKVSGTGGEFHPSVGIRDIYLGNAGTSYRLLLSTVALARGKYILTGSARMRERPIGDLLRALNKLGVEASCIGQDGFPPVSINARGIRGGRVAIEGDKSSQYVSSLLLAAPYTRNGVEIEVKGNLVSRPYVDVTVDVMKRFGVIVNRDRYHHFKIASGQMYQPCQWKIEGDVTNASYFWAAAAVTGGTVTTENVYPLTTNQGDICFLDSLEEMGCRVEREIDRVVVQGGTLSGIAVDMGTMPDMVPTLAAIALFAKGKTAIRNVSHLRHKESDRLKAIAMEWNRMGGRVQKLSDGLIIHADTKLSEAVVETYGDHRLAMALAVVGLKVPGIKIRNEKCVDKSFPMFWELWDKIS
jgi:3-phosphoshikimate 1-carboxyvinyltransferase